VCCASPSYLAARGEPLEPAALTAHDCIVWNERAPTTIWRFRSPTGPLSVEVSGRASADNAVLQLQWARAGLGVALLPRFLAQAPLDEGQLVELFPGRTIAFAGVVALYPSGQLLSPAVRAFVDLVAASFPAGRAGA
jgi:DNA-binding transcriptional LysR family regulator